MVNPNIKAANRAADSFYDPFNGGTVEIRTGMRPASPESPPTGKLLGVMNLPDPAFMLASNGGEKPKAGVWRFPVLADGKMGWFRMKTAAGDMWVDGEITLLGKGGDLEFDKLEAHVGETKFINTGGAYVPGER